MRPALAEPNTRTSHRVAAADEGLKADFEVAVEAGIFFLAFLFPVGAELRAQSG